MMRMLHAHPTRTLLIALAVLVAVGAVAYVLGMNYVALRQSATPAATDIPVPTPKDYVSAQKGFQYLVFYTDNGFAPETLSVKKGETVRFTNNSGGTLQLSLTGATPLTRGQYFEYTFTSSAMVGDGNINTMQVTVK